VLQKHPSPIHPISFGQIAHMIIYAQMFVPFVPSLYFGVLLDFCSAAHKLLHLVIQYLNIVFNKSWMDIIYL
jgi:hypothetical protein